MFIHDKLDEINKADDKAKYSRLIEQGWGEQVFANSNLINAAQNGAKEILQDMVSRRSYSDETKMAAMDAAIEHKQVDTVIVMGNAGNGTVQALYEWSKNAEDRPLLDRLINEGNYEPTGSAKQFLTEHCAHDTSYVFEAYENKNQRRNQMSNIDKLDNAIINDDLNAINQLKADDKNIDAFLGTKEYLNFVAGHGAKEILKDMLSNHDWSDDAKYDAMDQACENKQVESILVLGSQGENVFYSLNYMAREDDGKPIIDRVVNELDYKLSDSETKLMKEWTANAIENNGKYAVDMSYVANAYEQKEYKQAFKNFITNAEMTDGMDEQKAMLSASANGTAAHIDHYISIGDKANNEFWLKNLDVACHFGNNETAKRLVEHGAKVSDDNIKAAEKYLQPGTVEALKQAKLDQAEQQSFSMNRTHKPKSSQKKSHGLSLS